MKYISYFQISHCSIDVGVTAWMSIPLSGHAMSTFNTPQLHIGLYKKLITSYNHSIGHMYAYVT